MAGGPRLDLAAWSTADLVEAEDAIDDALLLLFKVRGTVKPTAAQEVKLAEQMAAAWKSGAEKGMVAPLRSVMSGKVTPSKLKTFLKRLGVALTVTVTPAQLKAITARLSSIWKTAKRIAAQEAKIKFSFAAVDKGAVEALAKQQVFWIGDFYNTHLSERIRGVADDVLIRRGLPEHEAGKTLRGALRREFGIVAGGPSPFGRSIPARFAGNPDLYFRGVASTVAHQARSFSKVTAFQEAGIVRYQLINPNDTRTGQICQQMSGQIFTVQQAGKQMQTMLSAKSPDDIRAAAPWLSGTELEDAIGGAKAGSQEAADNLLAAGASVLPPFHFLCRTEPVIID